MWVSAVIQTLSVVMVIPESPVSLVSASAASSVAVTCCYLSRALCAPYTCTLQICALCTACTALLTFPVFHWRRAGHSCERYSVHSSLCDTHEALFTIINGNK